MKDFEALKDIWQHQASLPKVSHEDVLKKVGKIKNAYANKLLLELLAMGAAIAGLGYIWWFTEVKMWTTHLAMAIFIVCCLYYLTFQIRDYLKIRVNSLLLNKPEEYISYLKKYKQNRHDLNTKKYKAYTLFVGFGFILSYIEISFTSPLWVTITGAIAAAIWIGYCYFILMRNYIRKEESKLQEMIENLERLQKQFGSEV